MHNQAVLELFHWPLNSDSVGQEETTKRVRIIRHRGWGFCRRAHASLALFWDYLHDFSNARFVPCCTSAR